MSYDSSTEHLLAELDRIDILLDGYSGTADDSLEIPADEVAPSGDGDPVTLTPAVPASVQRELDSTAETITTNIEQTDADVTLRLAHLVDTFDLSPRHRDVLLLALAPDIDPDYHDRFCRLQGDDAPD